VCLESRNRMLSPNGALTFHVINLHRGNDSICFLVVLTLIVVGNIDLSINCRLKIHYYELY
jgi:hypothetical protein